MMDKVPPNRTKKDEDRPGHTIHYVPYDANCFQMVLIHKMHYENLGLITAETENAILSMLIQIVRENLDFKDTIGRIFLQNISDIRLEQIRNYNLAQIKQQIELEHGDLRKRDLKDLKDEFKVSSAIRFTEKNEAKFFKLIAILVKNSE
jgi:hypothetical protein